MLPQKLISSASQRALSAQLCDCDGEFVRAQVGVVASFHVLDIADSINLASPLSPCFPDSPLQGREEEFDDATPAGFDFCGCDPSPAVSGVAWSFTLIENCRNSMRAGKRKTPVS